MPNTVRENTKAEAAAWLARLRASNRSPVDDAAFRAWLDENAHNATAFEAVTTMWESAGALPRNLLNDSPSRRTLLARRAVLASGICLIGGAAGVLALRPAQAKTYCTKVGEQRHVALDDGTQLFLDTDTSLTIRFSKTLRSANFLHGRASLRIPSDRRGIFTIHAADQTLTTDCATVDVSCEADEVSVVLLDGHAQCRSAEVPATQLAPGTRLVARPGEVPILDRPALAPLLAWQKRQAIFQDERLADAIVEMNRYSTTKLQLLDPVLADMRINGIYTVGDNSAFAGAIARLLPLKVRPYEQNIHLIASNSSAAN